MRHSPRVPFFVVAVAVAVAVLASPVVAQDAPPSATPFESLEPAMEPETVSGPAILRNEWVLSKLGPGKAKLDIRAIFGPGGLLIGSTECYDYHGSYSVEGKKLKVDRADMFVLSQTGCGPGESAQADVLLKALEEAKSWKVDKKGRLTIKTGGRYKDFDPVFAAGDPVSATGRGDQRVTAGSWRLSHLGFAGGLMEADFAAEDPMQVTLELGTDGSLRGESVCNPFEGAYFLVSDSELVTSGVASTAAEPCDEAAMEIENAVLAVLQTADGYAIEDGALVLEQGLLLSELRFEPVTTAEE